MERRLILTFVIIFFVGVLAVATWRIYQGYFNNEAIIDRAIQGKNPALCERVSATTRPGPADEPMKLQGEEAIQWCKAQVEFGQRVIDN